jgi:ATP-dependent Clp protease ATP-binding subunit ClpB
VLDDGRLTDGHGRTVNFKNTLIIMTSNLGSEIIQNHTNDSTYIEMKQQVMAEVSTHFRPEFINRVDDIVVFHSLGREEIKSIAKIQLVGLRQRLQEMGLQLEISAAALDIIAEAGFDPVYGARPLKRAIQTQIENPLAETLLSDKLLDKEIVRIDVVDGVLAIC